MSGWQFEQMHRTHVHRHLRLFQVEEGGVQAGELLHAHGLSRWFLSVAAIVFFGGGSENFCRSLAQQL